MAGNARRHRWHSRQPWHCGICNLQSLKEDLWARTVAMMNRLLEDRS